MSASAAFFHAGDPKKNPLGEICSRVVFFSLRVGRYFAGYFQLVPTKLSVDVGSVSVY